MTTPKKGCQGRKRKRENSESSADENELSNLPVNSLLVEKNITALAAKNNLDDQSVKKILKKVVTNDHVLALVKLREEEEKEVEEKVSDLEKNKLTPKLTRAKVKELKKDSSTIAPPWNLENLELTPIKHIPVKTRPEVKALIAQELPEDEDDEEYEPTHEDVASDDDQTLESCSDLDSEPRTPATPVPHLTASPQVVKDGPFKVPKDVTTTPVRRKLVIESDDATIARRTRSKLCLSETPIEHIESSFVPPDALPPVKDNLWEEFLQECLDPAPPSKHEDDDEADPEYNVAADPHAHDEEEEALECTNIEISEKELNDLVTELFKVLPDVASDDQLLQNLSNNVLTANENAQAVPKDEEPIKSKENDNLNDQQKENEGTNDGCKGAITTEGQVGRGPIMRAQAHVSVVHCIEEMPKIFAPSPPPAPPALLSAFAQDTAQAPPPMQVPITEDPLVLPQQVLILQQQIRQHVQLIASNFLQTCVHPQSWTVAPTYKEFLENLVKQGRKDPESVVNVCNLEPAWDLVNIWQDSVSKDTPENKQMVQFIQKEIDRSRRRASQNSMYVGDFHPTFMDTVANSTVFLYPYLLPPLPYRYDGIKRYSYSRAEDDLIALGMDMYWKYIEENPQLYKPPRKQSAMHRWGLSAAAELVSKHLMPSLPLKSLLAHIYHVRRTDDPENPIVKFFKNREVTPHKHELYPYNPNMTLYDQPEAEMPQIWLRHISKTCKRFRKHLVTAKRLSLIKQPTGVPVELDKVVEEPIKTPVPNSYFRNFPKVEIATSVPADPLVTTKTNENGDTAEDVLAKAKIYTYVETSEGPVLVPLKLVQSDSNKANETAEENVTIDDVDTIKGDSKHCTCCLMLRKMSECNRKTCNCDLVLSFNGVSKKLKALTSLFKTKKVCYMSNIKAYLDSEKEKDDPLDDWDMEDLTYAKSFQLKLNMWTQTSRERYMNVKVLKAFLNFDHNNGDPIMLTETLGNVFGAKLVELYKEFIGFLTPEQADKIGRFNDYFVNNCLQVFLKKMKELVADDDTRKSICKFLIKLLSKSQTSCEFCTSLMHQTCAHPELATCIYDMFPHTSIRATRCSRIAKLINKCDSESTQRSCTTASSVKHECAITHTNSTNADEADDPLADADKCVKTEPKGDSDSDEKDDRDTHANADFENDKDMCDADMTEKDDRDTHANADSENDKDMCDADMTEKDDRDTHANADSENDKDMCDADMTEKDDRDTHANADSENDKDMCDADMTEKDDRDTHANADSENDMDMCDDADSKADLNIKSEVDSDAGDTDVGEDDDTDLDPNKNVKDERIVDADVDVGEKLAVMDNCIRVVNGKLYIDGGKLNETQTESKRAIDTAESTIDDSAMDDDSGSDVSMVIAENVKSEPIEWKREEDKIILEMIMEFIATEKHENKTTMEVIEEKRILEVIKESLPEKSIIDIKERILCLLQILVVNT